MRITSVAVLSAALWISGCDQGPIVVPSELRGTWRTSEPRYAYAFIRIGAAEVELGTGEPGPNRHAIVAIENLVSSDRTLYTIDYRVGDQVQHLSLYYERRDGAALRLRNQPSFAWRREATP